MTDFMGSDSTYTQPASGQKRPQQNPYQMPTFSQLQQQGQARPAMPTYAQSFGYYGNPQQQPQAAQQPGISRVGPQGQQPGYDQPQGGYQPYTPPPAYGQDHQPPPITQPPPGQPNGITPEKQPPTGQPAQPGLNQQMQDFITNWMQNTNPYNQKVAQDIFSSLNTQAGHEFDVQRQLAQEQSARQGLSSSTLAQGRLGDIGIRQGEASTLLASQIAQQSAMTNAQSMQAAMQAAIGVSGNNFNQEYETNLFNTDQDQYYNKLLTMLLGGGS